MALTARIPLQLEPQEKLALGRRAKAAGITVNEYARRALRAPDRLRQPLAREGSEQRTTPWDAALKGIGSAVRRIRDQHGPDAIGLYVGTAAGFSMLHPIFAQGFMQGLGSKSLYASATQDCSNKFAGSEAVYGSSTVHPVPDFAHTDYCLILGSNPVYSAPADLRFADRLQKVRSPVAMTRPPWRLPPSTARPAPRPFLV